MLMHHVAWIPPTNDSWKLNFAGCLSPGDSGSGCILRDQNAIFKVACAVPIKNCGELIMAELTALHHGLLTAIKYGVDYIEIEGDQFAVIQMLASPQATPPLSDTCESILQDCFNCIKSFRSVRIRQIHRYSNDVANQIAQMATQLQEPMCWDGNPPPEIANMLVTDVIGRLIVEFA